MPKLYRHRRFAALAPTPPLQRAGVRDEEDRKPRSPTTSTVPVSSSQGCNLCIDREDVGRYKAVFDCSRNLM